MSIEEKYDEVRQLINIGKEKGYLLYDEVNELLGAFGAWLGPVAAFWTALYAAMAGGVLAVVVALVEQLEDMHKMIALIAVLEVV